MTSTWLSNIREELPYELNFFEGSDARYKQGWHAIPKNSRQMRDLSRMLQGINFQLQACVKKVAEVAVLLSEVPASSPWMYGSERQALRRQLEGSLSQQKPELEKRIKELHTWSRIDRYCGTGAAQQFAVGRKANRELARQHPQAYAVAESLAIRTCIKLNLLIWGLLVALKAKNISLSPELSRRPWITCINKKQRAKAKEIVSKILLKAPPQDPSDAIIQLMDKFEPLAEQVAKTYLQRLNANSRLPRLPRSQPSDKATPTPSRAGGSSDYIRLLD